MKRRLTYGQARAKMARLRGQLNAIETAAKSPRCLLRWHEGGDGDMMVAWVMDGREGEQSANYSELQRGIRCLCAEFGPNIAKSRRGNAVNIELPIVRKAAHDE